MSADTADPDPRGVRVPNSTLPPVPLTDEQLAPLAARDDVDAVYVPNGRPETVYTLAGNHQGDIMKFYVEFAGSYVKFRYGPTENGLAWLRHEPTSKTEPLGEYVAESIAEDYRPLEAQR